MEKDHAQDADREIAETAVVKDLPGNNGGRFDQPLKTNKTHQEK